MINMEKTYSRLLGLKQLTVLKLKESQQMRLSNNARRGKLGGTAIVILFAAI